MNVGVVVNTSWNVVNFRLGLCRALQNDGHTIAIITPSGEEQPMLEKEGFRVLTINNLSRKGRNPFNDLSLFWELRKLYKKERLNVVLHYTIKPVIYGTIAAHLSNVKAINTLTGLGYSFISNGLTNKIARLMYSFSLRFAKFNFFQNPDDRNLFLKLNLCSSENSGIVPGSGVDLTDFSYEDYRLSDRNNVLFVGRLLEDKGINEFVEAAAIVQETFPDIDFSVVGMLDPDNPASITADELEAWTQKGLILYHGTTDDVKPFLRKASVVVLPSYREGVPRVLLESAAIGRPVIATDVPGCREIVREGINGWLVPLKSPSALAKAILKARKSSDEMLEKIGANGREIVKAEFSEKIVISHYRTLIANLI